MKLLGRYLLLAMISLFPLQAWGGPVITVKAHTRIRILGLFTGEHSALLRGELQDQDLQTGIPGRTVWVEVRSDQRSFDRRVTTDSQGQFSIKLPRTRSRYRISARFDGDRSYAGQAFLPQPIDPAKENLQLEISMDSELDSDIGHHPVVVAARTPAGPAAVEISMSTDRGRALGQVRTDGEGLARLQITPSQLGAPGPVTVIARFVGDDRFNAATQRHEAILVARTTVTLTAKEQTVSADDMIHVKGEVADSRGPVAKATISIEADGRHVLSTQADHRGVFEGEINCASMSPGPLALVARFTPMVIWRQAAASPITEVTIQPPQPIPLAWFLVPASLSILVIALLFIRRYWPLLPRWGRTETVEGPQTEQPFAPVSSGLQTARSARISFRRQSLDISGTIWDPTDRHPVAGATVTLTTSSGERLAAQASSQGKFSFQGLPPGSATLDVGMAGYEGERITVELPHRGGLEGCRVDLVQIRVRVFEIYHQVALPLLPQDALWARWTPRELTHHLGSREGRRQASLEALTRLLEAVYWSSSLPHEREIGRARELAHAVNIAPSSDF